MLENDCKNGNGISYSKLGDMYKFGTKELKKDRKKSKGFYLKAEQFYIEACDGGDEQACKNLRRNSNH